MRIQASGYLTVVVEAPVWSAVLVEEAPSMSNNNGIRRNAVFFNKYSFFRVNCEMIVEDSGKFPIASYEQALREKIEIGILQFNVWYADVGSKEPSGFVVARNTFYAYAGYEIARAGISLIV